MEQEQVLDEKSIDMHTYKHTHMIINRCDAYLK